MQEPSATFVRLLERSSVSAEARTGSSGRTQGGIGGGEPATGGGGGTAVCVPGSQQSCYAGGPGTQGVGLCTAGVQTCLPDGSGYGSCTGEVTPSAEDCTTNADEDCDGIGQCSPAPLWSAGLGGAGSDAAYAVATDAAGNLYVTGWFEGTVDFGAGPLVSAGANDVFLLKLDPAGHAIWSRRFGSSDYGESGTKIALDASGNILLGGSYGGAFFDGPPPVDFGGGPLPWNYDFSTSAVFLVKLDPDGNHLWSRGHIVPTGAFSVNLRDIAVDAAGNSAALLAYPSSVDDGMSFLTFNAAGEYMWGFTHRTFVSSPGGVAMDSTFTGTPATIRGLTTYHDDRLVLVGDFTGTVDFGAGPLTAAGRDGFVTVLAP